MKNVKKLKILLITDSLSLGGAETHLLYLYRSLTNLGHFVTVVSCGGELSQNVRHEKIDLAAHSPIKLIRAYFALRALVRREGFDLIHAHARLPALIASFVAKKQKIPLLTTVHAHFNFGGMRRKFSKWGFRSVAVSEDLRIYLTQNYSIPSENITVIENGIDFEIYKKRELCTRSLDKPFTLIFLSRLDEDCSLCAKLLCKIAPRLFERYGNIQILIGGGGDSFFDISHRAYSVNSKMGFEAVRVIGKVYDVADFLSCGDVFIGVSRCALEAIASSIPVIIAGNEGFMGRLTEKNFDVSLASNFCARGEEKLTSELLFDSICSTIDNYEDAKSEAEKLCCKAEKRLDISVLASRYEDFYARSLEDYGNTKQKRIKTLLFGYYGFSNLGDDALLSSAVKRARGEFCGGVGALTRAPKQCTEHFGIPCYNRFSPFALISQVLRCDRLIFGGGTVFQDLTSRRSFIYYLFVLRLALFLKKEVLFYGVGIGEIKSGFARHLLYKSLLRVSYIGVRDERSFEMLRAAIPDSENLVLEDDLALLCVPSKLSRAHFLLYSALKAKAESFFVVCPHFNASRFDRFELELAIRKQKNKRFTPLFIPCSPYDIDLCKKFNKKFGGAILQNLTFSDLLSIFPFAKCVISMRYHPLLAARVSSVPFFPIGSDSKIEEFKGGGVVSL